MITYPPAGFAETLGDLTDVQQVIGVRYRGPVLERKNAGEHGALQGGRKREQTDNFGAFAGRDLCEESLKLFAW
ncbi:MAG: hypothetical protein OXP66_07440 [Candidatus Tectomicrobia bacterium]|nr:hypothetical protein [Candidatus Tectomicrobia bacterium]